MKHVAISALVVLGLSFVVVPARADQVVLKNGDKVTGTITSATKKDVIVQAELEGRTTIPWSAVSSVTATTAVRATLADGKEVEGVPVINQSRLSIRQADGTMTVVDIATARAFGLASERPAGPAWHAALAAALDLSRGNSETLTVATNDVATRLGAHDRLGLFATYLFSSLGSGATEVTSARTLRGGTRYDHDLQRVLYGFGFLDAENDPLQLLDYRAVVGGGAGAHAFKSDTSQFNVFAGVSYAKDSYSQPPSTSTTTTSTTTTTTGTGASTSTPGQGGTPPGQGGTPPGQGVRTTRTGTPPAVVNTTLSRSVAEGLVGQDLFHQLSDSVSLTEALTFYTAMADTSDYRIAFDLTLSAQLNGWLQWNLNVSDRYLNIPPAGGAVQNDTWISTGLGITFGGGATGAYRGSNAPPSRK